MVRATATTCAFLAIASSALVPKASPFVVSLNSRSIPSDRSASIQHSTAMTMPRVNPTFTTLHATENSDSDLTDDLKALGKATRNVAAKMGQEVAAGVKEGFRQLKSRFQKPKQYAKDQWTSTQNQLYEDVEDEELFRGISDKKDTRHQEEPKIYVDAEVLEGIRVIGPNSADDIIDAEVISKSVVR